MVYSSLLGHPSDEIVKFVASCGIFSLLLKNGEVVHFTPEDPEHFKEWLTTKDIEDIKG